MSISFSLPEAVEAQLRQRFNNVNIAAKEAALVELFRMGKLSHSELAMSLGISRNDVNALLREHGVTEDLLTLEEFDQQATALRNLLAQ